MGPPPGGPPPEMMGVGPPPPVMTAKDALNLEAAGAINRGVRAGYDEAANEIYYGYGRNGGLSGAAWEMEGQREKEAEWNLWALDQRRKAKEWYAEPMRKFPCPTSR